MTEHSESRAVNTGRGTKRASDPKRGTHDRVNGYENLSMPASAEGARPAGSPPRAAIT